MNKFYIGTFKFVKSEGLLMYTRRVLEYCGLYNCIHNTSFSN